MTRMATWLLLCFLPIAGFTQENLRPDRPVAFVGGMLLDGYETQPIHHSVVVLDDGRITAVGQRHNTEIPADAVIIDIGGKTIMPGLIDAHMHIALIGHGEYDDYYEFLNNMERLPEVMPIAAKQMMRGGVTSGLDLGAPFQVLEFRERIRNGELPGPRLTVSGPWLTRVYLDGVPDAYQIVVESPRDAAQKTRELIERGSDVIKTWVGLTAEEYVAVVEEAHKHGVKGQALL